MADARSLAPEILEYLLLRLREVRPGRAPNVAPPELHMAMGAMFAFHRAGVLDDASAERWREQIQDEGRGRMAVLEDEMAHPAPTVATQPPRVERARVQEVMDDQLARIETEIQGAASQGQVLYPWDSRALGVAQALLRALVETGILSELEERAWTEKLQRAADPDAEPIRTAHAQARSSKTVEAHVTGPLATGQQPLVHPPPSCSMQTLLDVLLVRAGVETGTRLEFIKIYADGFSIHWSMPAQPPSRSASTYMPRMPIARATDDLGTFYFNSGGNGYNSSANRALFRHLFAPGVPPLAKELRVTIDDDAFVIQLPVQSVG